MFKKIPISIKIFGIAVIMLLLFILVTFINYFYLNKVNRELGDMANHMVPLTEKMALVGEYALQQEISLEHVLLLYSNKPLKKQKLNHELEQLKERTTQIEQTLASMQQLGEKAIHYAQELDKIVEYARLKPYLTILGQTYQDTLPKIENIIRLLEQGKRKDAELLITQLTKTENDFAQQIEFILDQFTRSIEQAAYQVEQHEQQIIKLNLLLSTFAALLGILLSIVLIIVLTRPIHKLVHATKEVTTGNLDTTITVKSRDEIGILVLAFDKMVAGMKQKRQLKATFGQYVDPRIVDLLIKQQQSEITLGEQKMATVFFSDIAGFSSISELLTAKGLVKLINQYLTLASEPIINNQGLIDQFIGDAIIAFWASPFTNEEQHATLACFSALEQLEQLEKLRQIMPELLGIKKGLPNFDVRIGIASSTVVAGHFGSEQSKSYTIMGNATLVAEALETASKTYGTTILISENVKQNASEQIETRRIAHIVLPNSNQASNVYELLCKKGELSQATKHLRDLFEQGLIAYETKNWQNATILFQRCQQMKADDKPTLYYLTQLANQHKKISR